MDCRYELGLVSLDCTICLARLIFQEVGHLKPTLFHIKINPELDRVNGKQYNRKRRPLETQKE